MDKDVRSGNVAQGLPTWGWILVLSVLIRFWCRLTKGCTILLGFYLDVYSLYLIETPINLNSSCVLYNKANVAHWPQKIHEMWLRWLQRPFLRTGQLDEFKGFWPHKSNWGFKSTKEQRDFQVPGNKHRWLYSTKQDSRCNHWLLVRRCC